MLKRLCQDQPKQWHRLINPVLFAYREVPQESTGFSPFQLLYGRSVRGPRTILKELWTKEVNIPEKTSCEYVSELRERLEDSLKLAQEELQKSQKDYDRKAKPRCLEVGEQVLILLPTDSNKLLMQWRGPYIVESRVGASDYRIKIGSKTKTYHLNMLKKYIAREPEVDVVHTSNKDGCNHSSSRSDLPRY